MSFRWSSPVRRDSNGALLSPIPAEIYIQILDFIRPVSSEEGDGEGLSKVAYKRILSNIALVCRYFGSIVLPRIFHTLEFDGSSRSEETGTTNNASFCRAITKNQAHARALAQHVRDCTLSRWSMPEDLPSWLPSWGVTGFLNLYRNAITHMNNIHKLELILTPINKSMIRTISKLKQLRILSIKLCKFEADCTKQEFQKLSALQLTHLTFSNPPPNIFRPEDEDSLNCSFGTAIDYSYMEHLVTFTWSSVKKVAGMSEELPLKLLDVFSVDDASLLSKVLKNTPYLKTLHLQRVELSFAQFPFNLDPSLAPMLEDVKCATVLLPELIPGRPVSKISISMLNYPVALQLLESEFQAMARSSKDMRILKIPYPAYFVAPLTKYFDHLEELCLDLMHPNFPVEYPTTAVQLEHMLKEIVSTYEKHVPIWRLSIATPCPKPPSLLDLPSQHAAIADTLSKKFLQLKEVALGDHLVWRKDAAGSWNVTIATQFVKNLQEARTLGRLSDEDYIDHNGVLDDIFFDAAVDVPIIS